MRLIDKNIIKIMDYRNTFIDKLRPSIFRLTQDVTINFLSDICADIKDNPTLKYNS